MKIPVTIFVSTGHLEQGGSLWFSYLKALCFENTYKKIDVNQTVFPLQTLRQRKRAWAALSTLAKAQGDPVGFCRVLASQYPLTSEVAALYAGMTYEQVKMASESGVVTIGAHTVWHPFLDKLTENEQKKEIVESKSELSRLVGKPVDYFAYPSGDYTSKTVALVKAAGYKAAFATLPKNIESDGRYEIKRIGIYSQSLLKLQLKTAGFADWVHRFGLHIG
jgi:peptidoglycan/xylan/chitin deacetylase (PgdA/CDA1 family)